MSVIINSFITHFLRLISIKDRLQRSITFLEQPHFLVLYRSGTYLIRKDFLMLYQMFFSPQVKRSVIISNKHGINETKSNQCTVTDVSHTTRSVTDPSYAPAPAECTDKAKSQWRRFGYHLAAAINWRRKGGPQSWVSLPWLRPATNEEKPTEALQGHSSSQNWKLQQNNWKCFNLTCCRRSKPT